MNRLIYTAVLLVMSFILTGTDLFAQVIGDRNSTGGNDTTKVKDILKEFEYDSFKDAAIKVKDSTVLKQHLLGVKWGYSMSNVHFSQDIGHKSVKSPKNLGLYYIYLHSLWHSMPYFGFQAGLEYNESGYTLLSGKEPNITESTDTYKNLALSMEALFRVEFWKMRIMLTAGPYLNYKQDWDLGAKIPEGFKPNKWGYGIMGGGGFAFIMHPFELHLTASYRYNMSGLYDPKLYSEEYWTYTHENQLLISFGIFYRFKNKYSRKRN